MIALMKTITLFGVLLVSSVASAQTIDECGDLTLTSDSQCELVVGTECTAMCEPVSLTASCAAELYVDCAGECSASATVECTGSCQADCEAECTVDPGSYDCEGGCYASCEGSCDASCAASANMAECQASCRATCSGECDVSCEGTPPTADCTAKCQASCEGSCNAEANVDCQVSCQSSGYATCTADLMGGCTTQCAVPTGALFCDGQYVNAGATLADCLLYLEEELDVDVAGYVSGECVGNMCEVEAGASCSCQVGGRSAGGPIAAIFLGFVALGAVWRRRR